MLREIEDLERFIPDEPAFRKCSVSECPYKATYNSIYCKRHLVEFEAGGGGFPKPLRF